MKIKHQASKGCRINHGFHGLTTDDIRWWFNFTLEKWEDTRTTKCGYSSHQHCKTIEAFRRKLKKAPKGVKFTLVSSWEGRDVTGMGTNNKLT